MYTLLETCLERLDIFEFITHMENGLRVSSVWIFFVRCLTCRLYCGGVRAHAYSVFSSDCFNMLQDQHDIKLLTYLMLARLAALCPSQVLQRLDSLCEPLKVRFKLNYYD